MLPLLSDEDLRGAIVDGLRRHFPDIDLVRVQDVGLIQSPDPRILQYAAEHRRVVVTHDRNTMVSRARDRIDSGQAMAGVVVVEQLINIGKAIQELGTLAQAGEPGDLDGQILFLS
jgi:hypothetical protein